jgi:uncharacterized protein YkwD
MVRRSSKGMIVVALLMALLSLASIAAPAMAQTTTPTPQQQLLNLVNNARRARGLVPVVACARLNLAAQRHSNDMAARNYFSHTAPAPAPSGAAFWQRILATGYRYTAASENIALGYTTATQVFNAWMASPGHRANLLNANVRHMGSGFARGTRGMYWTQTFGAGGVCQ